MCEVGFIVDSMSGKVAKWLRIVGCDVLYADPSQDDSTLLGRLGERVLVTRDKELVDRAKRTGKHVVLVPEDVEEALAMISLYYNIQLRIRPGLTRCPFCNEKLEVRKRDSVLGMPREVVYSHSRFLICPSCGKVFWFGTHYWEMLRTLSRVKKKKWKISNSWGR